jgi:MarR family transcriptional regulator, transcriptional regulator for hemolysin
MPQRASVTKRTNTEPVSQLSADIHELSLLIARLFNQKVKGMGFTRTQWMVLDRLHREGEQSQTQLANSLSMAKPPLGKVIDKLQEEGWVSRRRNPRDRRENLVSPTRAVDPLVEPLNLIVQGITENAMIGLTNVDRQNLSSLLDKMHSNLLKALEEKT